MLTNAFVTAVQRQGQFTSDLTSADILAAADIEVAGRLVPLLRVTHQEYLVAEATLTSYGGKVALPARAVMGGVRQVQLLTGTSATNLPQMQLESDVGTPQGGTPCGWYFDGGAVVLLPRGSNATVRVRYCLRPSAMVASTLGLGFVERITVATQDGAGGYALTATAAQAAAATLYDVVSAGPSHVVCAIDRPGSGLTTFTVPSTALLSPIAVGDYWALAGTTPFVPVPEELTAALIHQVAGTLLRALAYDSEASQQLLLAEKALDDGQRILAPRSEGNPRRLVGGIRRALGMGEWFRGGGW